MRIAVVHGPSQAGFGGRLRADLARRLEEEVGGAVDGAGALVVVVGRGWARDPSEQPARQAVRRALGAGLDVVPFVIEGAAMPPAGDLPPELGPFAAVEPVRASSEYWESSVERVVERVPRAAGRRRRIDGRTVLKTGAAVIGTAASVVGILAALGVFVDPAQRATVAVQERAANGVTLDRYLAEEDPPRPPAYGVPADTQGYVYGVRLRLANPSGDRYALRWTMVDEGSGGAIAGFEAKIALSLASEDVAGLHKVWIPCPEIDAQRYVISFELVEEADRSRSLDDDDSPPGECRLTEL